MSVSQKQDLAPPLVILGILHSQWAAFALRSAVQLNLFQQLKGKPKTAQAVAKELSIDPKGASLLLDAMVGVKLLSKTNSAYALTEVAENYLLPDSPLFMGTYIDMAGEIYQRWAGLTETIRTGKPVMEVNTDEEAKEFFPPLTRGIFPMSYACAETTGRALGLERLPAGARVLDVAAGSGAWSIPLVKANPGLKVDALDFEPVLEVTREFAERHGVAKQYQYLTGNWRDISLDEQAYDVIILGHILHSEGDAYSRELLAKCCKAMKAGGRLIIGEFIPNEERTGPAHPLMFALNMFLFTSEGCVFTQKEMEQMCKEAGFSKANRLQLPFYGDDSPVLVAVK